MGKRSSSKPRPEAAPARGARRWRRVARALFIAAGVYALLLVATAAWLFGTADDQLDFLPSGRLVTDVTQLEKIQVGRVERPKSTEEIASLLRETTGPISIGGARCSMGGQIAEPGSLHLDLRGFNRVLALDVPKEVVTVQAGITWRELQEHLDPHDLSVAIMQTYANFTVGGSLSVNAHGRYMGRGPVVQSVRSIRLVLADGSIVTASPTENADLFYAAIGGYGGIGVIAEVTLELAKNGKIERSSRPLATSEYAAYFEREVRSDKATVFHNADLHPPDFASGRAISWRESDAELTDDARLIPRHDEYFWTPTLINGSVSWPGGLLFREHVLEPLFFSRPAVTFRNHEASYDIAELEPESRADSTYVLREYFVPAARFDDFVPKMRDVFLAHDVDVVNVSVRHASADPGTLLAWARGETFAFVVYYRQGTTKEAIAKVGEWSRELVDAVLSVGGTYYLPYQNHATRAQFESAYPRHAEYDAIKRRVDPGLRFQNSFIYHYGESPRRERDEQLARLDYVRKPEGQTLLTIPEWYLVWNPVEYAEHLEAGRPSDTFPYFESVREYASLYKKVLRASAGTYPDNDEYLTMLRVIGVSTAVEYIIKGSYEATLGRLARIGASGSSPEERVIARASRAYSQLIYDEPWYEFRFLPWVGRIWAQPLGGADWLRRTERKLAFSAEYLTKAAYASLLGWAAKSAYGPAEERIQLVVRSASEEAPHWPEGVQPLPELKDAPDAPGRLDLVSVERWKEFSEQVPALARDGVDFVEIAGNDDIAVSVIEPRTHPLESAVAARLLRSRVVSRPEQQRSVWFVPVPHLRAFLGEAQGQGVQLEHLYDY